MYIVSIISRCIIFCGTALLFSTAVVSFPIPTISVQWFQFLYILTNICIIYLFGNSYPKCFSVGLAGKESACNTRDLGLIPGLRRAPGLTPVFLPGKSHGQGSLTGYSPWGCKNQTQPKQLNKIMMWCLIVVVICISLIICDVALLLFAFDPLNILFAEMFVHILCSCFNQVVVFIVFAKLCEFF